ncbi:trypsin-like peptidase domain-containing protein [Microbacterium sp. ARD32]|uniref:S1C family serine protease n=1 Tax=Microbacterium sp. ARD32 TaxID=2962577 RepID=UPI00288114DC|nr:trypsin-like peptidase domain-containing protein [Microbacterium sp. ARD32]MDT0156728.1 trypsin-like peptidase domain-containing protein [Microbacterium sp. ARD32]
MNDDNTNGEGFTPGTPAPQQPAAQQHASQQPSAQHPTPQVQPPQPVHPSASHPGYSGPAHLAPHPTGSAFGGAAQAAPQHPAQHQTAPQGGAPTLPLDPTLLAAPADSSAGASQPRGNGPLKVAGLLLAAALVGGVAGLGGSVLGSSMTSAPTSQSATGPQTVTVNNPGSVNETTAIAADVLPSVVTINVNGTQQAGSGSGVILSKDGYVMTNTHVVTLGGSVADPTISVTTSDGHIYSATVVGTDPIYDLAVIKLKGASGLKPIEFGDSSKLNVGDAAVAIGAPLGLSNSVTDGIVSALNRSIQVASSAVPDDSSAQSEEGGVDNGNPFQFDLPGMPQQQQPKQSISIAVIQTDAAINPGNSGGALVDSRGRLIGVNVAIATAGQSSSSSSEPGSIGVGFAIPADIAQRVSSEIIDDGAATHGLLGARVRDASSLRNASIAGAVISSSDGESGVVEGGAAAEAGLKDGDIVTEFNGSPITGATDLTAQVRAEAAGSTVKITYVRNGRTYETEATLGTLKL